MVTFSEDGSLCRYLSGLSCHSSEGGVEGGRVRCWVFMLDSSLGRDKSKLQPGISRLEATGYMSMSYSLNSLKRVTYGII